MASNRSTLIASMQALFINNTSQDIEADEVLAELLEFLDSVRVVIDDNMPLAIAQGGADPVPYYISADRLKGAIDALTLSAPGIANTLNALGLTGNETQYSGYTNLPNGSLGSILTYVDGQILEIGSIDNHTDVDTTTAAPAVGEVLKWDGLNWTPAADSGGTGSDGNISNVAFTTSPNLAFTGTGGGFNGNVDLSGLIANLETLSGAGAGAANLGPFTSPLVPDSLDIKATIEGLAAAIALRGIDDVLAVEQVLTAPRQIEFSGANTLTLGDINGNNNDVSIVLDEDDQSATFNDWNVVVTSAGNTTVQSPSNFQVQRSGSTGFGSLSFQVITTPYTVNFPPAPPTATGQILADTDGTGNMAWVPSSSLYLGLFATQAALTTAHPSPAAGAIAFVGTGADSVLHKWDGTAWVASSTPLWYPTVAALQADQGSPNDGDLAFVGLSPGIEGDLYIASGGSWQRMRGPIVNQSGASISMANLDGTEYGTIAAPETTVTAFTIDTATQRDGGHAVIFYNNATEPTFTGATKSEGSPAFVPSATTSVIIRRLGGANKYFFLQEEA